MSDEKKPIKNRKWIFGKLEDKLIFISILLIFFAFCAPFFFTNTSNIKFDATTGQIGDTIGGTMNPYITLAGVFVTFLAFYIQYKANQSQRKQFLKGLKESERLFKESLQAEKNKEIRKEKLEYYYYLSLLKHTLELIIKDFEKKIAYIKEYYEKQKINKNFEIYELKQLPDKNFIDIQKDIDKLLLYKGFRAFFTYRPKWIKEYMQFYDVLVHLGNFDKAIKIVYKIYKGREIKRQKELIEHEINNFIYYCDKALKLPDYQNYLDFNEEIKKVLEDFTNGSKDFERIRDIIDIKEDLFTDFQEHSKTLKNYSIDNFISRAFNAKTRAKAELSILENLIQNEAHKIERLYKVITVKSYYNQLKKSKLILDEELAKIDVEKL